MLSLASSLSNCETSFRPQNNASSSSSSSSRSRERQRTTTTTAFFGSCSNGRRRRRRAERGVFTAGGGLESSALLSSSSLSVGVGRKGGNRRRFSTVFASAAENVGETHHHHHQKKKRAQTTLTHSTSTTANNNTNATTNNAARTTTTTTTTTFIGMNENMFEYRSDVEKSRIITSARELDQRRVLVLDVAMQTSNIVSWQKALILAMFDKVDVLEYYEEMVASAYSAFYLPAVVKTRVYDKQKGSISLSRKNVLIRDNHSCTYCGAKDDLTIDHIVPASKGGEWSWTNLTTACAKCNNRKGDKYLKQCNGMKLIRPAKEPSVASGEFSQFSRIVNPPDEWIPFIDPRHVKRIPEGFMDDLEFGDVSIKNNVVDVEKTLLKVKSKNNKKKKSKSGGGGSSSSSSSSSSGAR